jgi:hypothetical protein
MLRNSRSAASTTIVHDFLPLKRLKTLGLSPALFSRFAPSKM